MATSAKAFTSTPTEEDPYTYQHGFGNRFMSEALEGVIPEGQNTPQKLKYDLYPESLNGTSFIATRAQVQNIWFYRIRPSVDHDEIKVLAENPDIVADFSRANTKTFMTPVRLKWNPLQVPTEATDFVEGIKSIIGSGEPTENEGVAIHLYACNKSMDHRAFLNMDGDMLILPVEGRLDIQTECGKMMVKPGELVVVQKGHKWSVSLPDGSSRGYIQEIYGSNYELPELGVVGTNGLAAPRDFQTPVAHFDLDIESSWEIVIKCNATLWSASQDHTPFDVVAWHGNYAPYKYDLHKFVTIGILDRDQMDPTIYCVLTAKSKQENVSIADFNAFLPKWNVSTNTFRPPYYHRHLFSEVGGMCYGPDRGESFSSPGGLTYQPIFGPHGLGREAFEHATNDELKVERTGEGMIGFQMHIGRSLSVSDYALNRSKLLVSEPRNFFASETLFLKHVPEINAQRSKQGLPELVAAAKTNGKVNGKH